MSLAEVENVELENVKKYFLIVVRKIKYELQPLRKFMES